MVTMETPVAIDLAFCGLDCGGCPAFHADLRLTEAERQAVAEKWNVGFGGSHTAADSDCVGCTHEGRHAPYCESGREIRKCAAGKAVATCAECPTYEGEDLADFRHCPRRESEPRGTTPRLTMRPTLTAANSSTS